MLRRSFAVGLVLVLLFATAAYADTPGWPSAGGGPGRNGVTVDSLKPSLYIRWSLPLGDPSLTTPVVAGGNVYVATYSGVVYAAAAAAGQSLWTYQVPLAGFGKVYGLSYSDGKLYMTGTATQGNVLVALDVSSAGGPKLAWQAALPEWSAAAPLVSDGVVVVGANDGTLVAFAAATGQEQWRQRLQGDFWRANQAAANGTVIALSYFGGVYAFDLATGTPRWSDALGGEFDPGASPVVVGADAAAGSVVYVASSQDWHGKVAAYDLADGKRLWAFETDRQDNLWQTPVVTGGRVYMPLQGSLYTLDAATGQPVGNPFDAPTYYQDGRTYKPNLATPLVGADSMWLPATFQVAGPLQIYTLGLQGGHAGGPILRRSPLPARLGSGLAYDAGVLYFTGQNNTLYAMSPLTVLSGGSEVRFPDVPAYLSPEGRFMVPLRFVLEATDAQVQWVAETQTVMVQRGSTTIEMQQGSRDVKVNGQLQTMDTAVTSVDGRTVVPLRFLTDWLGGTVEWSQNTLTASLQLP
ncbi:MAG: stalk domain-containing protein [Symbiobacteriia bacterium]